MDNTAIEGIAQRIIILLVLFLNAELISNAFTMVPVINWFVIKIGTINNASNKIKIIFHYFLN